MKQGHTADVIPLRPIPPNERYWLEVKATAERQLAIANRELGKIATRRILEGRDETDGEGL